MSGDWETFERVMLWSAWPHLFEAPSLEDQATARRVLDGTVSELLQGIEEREPPECLRGPNYKER